MGDHIREEFTNHNHNYDDDYNDSQVAQISRERT
jgi:hypothetical protein